MPFEAILNEVEKLHTVSTRFTGLAEQQPAVSEALIPVAGSVRNAATVLAVLVATQGSKPIWNSGGIIRRPPLPGDGLDESPCAAGRCRVRISLQAWRHTSDTESRASLFSWLS